MKRNSLDVSKRTQKKVKENGGTWFILFFSLPLYFSFHIRIQNNTIHDKTHSRVTLFSLPVLDEKIINKKLTTLGVRERDLLLKLKKKQKRGLVSSRSSSLPEVRMCRCDRVVCV
jgi:hypothetical protein